jgi:hypothetical protein
LLCLVRVRQGLPKQAGQERAVAREHNAVRGASQTISAPDRRIEQLPQCRLTAHALKKGPPARAGCIDAAGLSGEGVGRTTRRQGRGAEHHDGRLGPSRSRAHPINTAGNRSGGRSGSPSAVDNDRGVGKRGLHCSVLVEPLDHACVELQHLRERAQGVDVSRRAAFQRVKQPGAPPDVQQAGRVRRRLRMQAEQPAGVIDGGLDATLEQAGLQRADLVF